MLAPGQGPTYPQTAPVNQAKRLVYESSKKYYCGLLLGSNLVHFSSHIMAMKYTNIDPASPKELFSLNLEGHPV